MGTDKIKIGFLGLGLIGGSIAKALKKRISHTVSLIAYDIDESSLKEAKKDNIIAVCYTDLYSFPVEETDILFLCAPVEYNVENLQKIVARLPEKCIITDVGSVKGEIRNAIDKLKLSSQFIGGHPMAGSEKTGFSNASDRLLENAYYILTPDASIQKEQLDTFITIIKATGALPLIMTEKEHDYVTAGISHLPHVISAALVNLVKNNDTKDSFMHQVAAGGFKDITRISSSSPIMWEQICMENKDNILHLLDLYMDTLNSFKQTLVNDDNNDINSFFANAKDYRDTFSEQTKGPIQQVYRIYADIPDVPGVIAKIASLLASHNINIRNIGIIHNREFEKGALRIEIYDMEALTNATTILQDADYQVTLP